MKKVTVTNENPCGDVRHKVVFVEWEDERYYHGYYLNKHGKVFVEVPKENCEEFTG